MLVQRAIESVFDRLVLKGDQASEGVLDEDAITNAMQSAGLDSERTGAVNRKVGQIVVEIERIRLGTKRLEGNYRPKHREGRNDDVDMDRQEFIHATGYDQCLTLNHTLAYTDRFRMILWPRISSLLDLSVWWTTGPTNRAKVSMRHSNFSTEAMVFAPLLLSP